MPSQWTRWARSSRFGGMSQGTGTETARHQFRTQDGGRRQVKISTASPGTVLAGHSGTDPASQDAWAQVWNRATKDIIRPAPRPKDAGLAAALGEKPVRPDAEALSIFFRSLATMTAAGVMIDRSLDHLGKHAENPRMANLISDIARRVSGGVMLSTAFEVHHYAFSALQLRMLAVGERTGTLHVVLARLADYEEKRRGTSMKVQAALVYPMFLMSITTFMLVVLPPYMFEGCSK